MTIKKAIEQLTKAAEKVGEDAEFVVMRAGYGENDYIKPDYTVVCDMEDQDGNTFRCAMIGESGGEELTEKGIPHYEWDPSKSHVCV